MTQHAIAALDRAIAALTYDEIVRYDDRWAETARDGKIPLLQRSIGQDLIEMAQGRKCSEKLLRANAAAIDEALLAIAEARAALEA